MARGRGCQPAFIDNVERGCGHRCLGVLGSLGDQQIAGGFISAGGGRRGILTCYSGVGGARGHGDSRCFGGCFARGHLSVE